MGAVVIRGTADVPGAACTLVGFVPTESVVVLGLGPITPGARFDIDAGMLDAAREVIERFRLHRVTRGILVLFTGADPGLLLEALTPYCEAHGFEVLDAIVADGVRATGRDGRAVPYVVPPGLGTREEFARSQGIDPAEAFIVGKEPKVPNH
jgi:hypothetical protein